MCCCLLCFFFFKQKTAYDMRISDWSSDVCSSDLEEVGGRLPRQDRGAGPFVLAALIVDRHTIELGGRIALAAEADEAAGKRLGGRVRRRTGQIVEHQAMDRRADGLVVGEFGAQLLLVVRVAQAEPQLSRVGDVTRISGEPHPNGAVL